MPPEREAMQAAHEVWLLNHPLVSVFMLMVVGTLGRILISKERVDWYKLAGELLLAGVGAVLLYSAGLMQDMTKVQIVFLGALGGLGGVRLLEWIIKIVRTVKESN